MAQRIGDTIRPELMLFDYMPGTRAVIEQQQRGADLLSLTIAGLSDNYTKRRDMEQSVNASNETLRAALEMVDDPVSKNAIAGALVALGDPKKSLSERYKLTDGAAKLLDFAVAADESDKLAKYRGDMLQLDRDRFMWEKGAEERVLAANKAEAEAVNGKLLADAVAAYFPVKELEGPLADKLPDMDASSELIEKYIEQGNGYAAKAAAESYATIRNKQLEKLGVSPTLKPHKIGGEKDGKPYEMDVLIDPQGNLYNLNRQPLTGGGTFIAPTTHYSTGAAVGGPDELQDPWTNKGYSATGKNLTPGMAAVNPKVHPMGTVFEDADTGEVFIAGDKHGNANPNVIDIYLPPDQYTQAKGARNLRVVGREQQVGRTPAEVAAQVSKWKAIAGGLRMAGDGATTNLPAWGEGTGGQSVGPAIDEELLRQAMPAGDMSRVPFGQLPPGYSNAGVLPPMPVAPVQGAPTRAPNITLGQRPLVSPTTTPEQVQQMRRAESGDRRLENTLAEAQTLAASVPALKQTAALLDQVRTGFGAEAMTAAKRILGADVSSAEQLQTLLGDQVIARVGQTKGAVSEKEMDLFQQYSANFAKTPDGNRKIVAWQLAAADRAQKIARTIQAGFQAGKDPYTIEAEVAALRDAESLNAILTPPPPAPKGIPVEEDAENEFFNKKPPHLTR